MSALAVPASRWRRLWRFTSQAYRLELSYALEYRGSMIGWVVLGATPLIAAYFLWSAIYGNDPDRVIRGFDFDTMITYQFLITMFFQINMPWSVQSAISQEIRSGEINRYMIRPIPYRLYRVIRYTGFNTVFLLLLIIPSALILYGISDHLVFLSWQRTLLALLAAALAFWLQFLLVYALALNAFWWDEVFGIFLTYNLFSRFAAGELIPLSFLPDWLRAIVDLTPFPSVGWFPLQLYLDPHLTNSEIIWGFCRTLLWMVAAMGLGSLLWWRGNKKYSAFGG